MADQTLKTPPDDLLPQVHDATARLLATAERLDDEELRRPSLLPGWSRAHVLTHLSRGADSRIRLLVAARTRTRLRQYHDERSREQEIEQGATRTRDEILVDLRTSADRLATAIADYPPQWWSCSPWTRTGSARISGGSRREGARSFPMCTGRWPRF